MALDRTKLEEDILLALTDNLADSDKIPEVMGPLENYAALLSTAVHNYVLKGAGGDPETNQNPPTLATRSWHNSNDDT